MKASFFLLYPLVFHFRLLKIYFAVLFRKYYIQMRMAKKPAIDIHVEAYVVYEASERAAI